MNATEELWGAKRIYDYAYLNDLIIVSPQYRRNVPNLTGCPDFVGFGGFGWFNDNQYLTKENIFGKMLLRIIDQLKKPIDKSTNYTFENMIEFSDTKKEEIFSWLFIRQLPLYIYNSIF